MATNQGVGGLYATVELDIQQALRQVRVLEAALKKTFSSITTGGPGAANGLNALGQAAQKTSGQTSELRKRVNEVKGDLKRMDQEARAAAKSTAGLGDNMRDIGNTLSTTLASFGAARSGNYFYGLSSGLQAVTRGFGSSTSAGSGFNKVILAGVGTVAALAVGLGTVAVGLKKITEASVKSSANLERLSVSFKALLGSEARAAEELQFLIKAAEISPYFTEAIVSLDRFLLAQGLLNDELRRGITKRLIDFGSAAGLSGDQLQNLAYALGQVYNAGRITGDEARQLRNNFLGVQNVLRSLPRYANETGQELARAMEAGEISSQDFFEGFFAYTERFGQAALDQQQTLIGLRDTFLDIVNLGLGKAGLELANLNAIASPLGNLRALFKDLLNLFNEIDFRPLVASLGLLINTFLGPFGSFLNNEGRSIKYFFEFSLPRAVLFTANVFRSFSAVFSVFGTIVSSTFRAIIAVFAPLVRTITGGSVQAGDALKYIGRAAILVAAPLILTFTKWAVSITLVLSALSALITLISTGSLGSAWEVFKRGLSGAANIVVNVATGLVDAWNALDNLKPLSYGDLFAEDMYQPPPFVAGGADGGFPASGGGDSAAGGSAAAKAMEKAMGVLFDLTRRWFETRSELESGFLGKEGFEATVDSIISTGRKLIEALEDISGSEDIVRKVREGTYDLIALAKQREVAAAALREAEKALAEAIRARDSFAEKVKNSAIAFANAFKTETESVRQFQLFSERGFFYETEVKQQKDFVQSLKDRLKALKDFMANLKTLRDRGLDQNLLEQLLAAGPEQAGEVAAALAAGGQDIISEVNVLQGAVTQVAEELGQFGADEFYQAGVDMAQANVNGLTAELGSIESAATAITESIFNAVLPLAKELEDAGAAGGAGLAAGLASGGDAIKDILAGISDDADQTLGKMKGGFGDLPGSFAGAINAGSGTARAAFEGFLDGIGGEFNDFLGLWEQDLTTLQVSWNDVWAGLNAPVQTAFNNLRQTWIDAGNEIKEVYEDGVNAARTFVEGIVNAVIVAFETLVNGAVEVINFLIRAYNAIPLVPKISEIGWRANFGRLDLGEFVIPYRQVGPNEDLGNAGLYPMNPTVKVYIGETELTDIVDTRVDYNNGLSYTGGLKGRRVG